MSRKVMFHVKQSSDQQHLLQAYVSRVLEKNHAINLTSITDPDQASLLLLEDSLTGVEKLETASPGPYGL